jgi:hypothetical protein
MLDKFRPDTLANASAYCGDRCPRRRDGTRPERVGAKRGGAASEIRATGDVRSVERLNHEQALYPRRSVPRARCQREGRPRRVQARVRLRKRVRPSRSSRCRASLQALGGIGTSTTDAGRGRGGVISRARPMSDLRVKQTYTHRAFVVPPPPRRKRESPARLRGSRSEITRTTQRRPRPILETIARPPRPYRPTVAG